MEFSLVVMQIETTKDFIFVAKARRIKRFYSRALKPYGLTYESYCLLEIIKNNKNITLSGLGYLTGQEMSTICRIIDRTLIGKKLLDKRRNENDRRILCFYLTRKGNKLIKELSESIEKLVSTSSKRKQSA